MVMCYFVFMEVNNLLELAFSSYHVGFRSQTQVAFRLGRERLYPPS